MCPGDGRGWPASPKSWQLSSRLGILGERGNKQGKLGQHPEPVATPPNPFQEEHRINTINNYGSDFKDAFSSQF